MIARCLLGLALFLFLASPVAAQEATDANLITAIDVSGSVKPRDERLELEGMAQAVADPMFLEAIQRGMHGRDRLRRVHLGERRVHAAGAVDADRLAG